MLDEEQEKWLTLEAEIVEDMENHMVRYTGLSPSFRVQLFVHLALSWIRFLLPFFEHLRRLMLGGTVVPEPHVLLLNVTGYLFRETSYHGVTSYGNIMNPRDGSPTTIRPKESASGYILRKTVSANSERPMPTGGV